MERTVTGEDNVEKAGGRGKFQETADRYAADHPTWDSDEDAERLASDLSSDRAEGGRQRRPRSGHISGDRDEPGYAHKEEPETKDKTGRGRAASGESYEDEADEVFFRPKQS